MADLQVVPAGMEYLEETQTNDDLILKPGRVQNDGVDVILLLMTDGVGQRAYRRLGGAAFRVRVVVGQGEG